MSCGGRQFFGLLAALGIAVVLFPHGVFAQNPTTNVTLQGADVAVVNAGTYTTPASYWNGALLATNNGTFNLSGNWTSGVNFQSQWTGGSYSNNLVAANGDNAGDAGYLTTFNHGDVTLTGNNLAADIYGVRFAMLGGIGGTGTGNGNAGNGGNANGILNAYNTGSVSLSASEATGGSGFFVGAIGGAGGNTDGMGKVGSGGDADGGNLAAAIFNNSGSVQVGSEGSFSTGTGDFSAITDMARGGDAGIRGNTDSGDTSAIGGNAGSVSLIHSGSAGIWWQAKNTESHAIYGILATSLGGLGSDSGDNGTSAGAGGNSGPVTISTSAGASVQASAANETSDSADAAHLYGAALAAISRGGDGGTTAGDSDGGRGGAGATDTFNSASLTNTLVEASGNAMEGVLVLTEGGHGGHGTEEHSHSNGGNGGDAGATQASLTGANGTTFVSTAGNDAPGVHLYSHGGGGGFGGPNEDSMSYSSGDGGNGGMSETSSFQTTGAVQLSTTGGNSSGILAVTRGGLGGMGGLRIGDDNSAGDGGSGGSSGYVFIDLHDETQITTSGTNSPGLTASSLGGKGGVGGYVNTLGGTPGEGGNGGSSGMVVGNTGTNVTITTYGNSSPALLLQSLSGVGGAGGNVDDVFGVHAGKGGDSGDAGARDPFEKLTAITFSNAATLKTTGENSIGILAQAMSGAAGTSGIAEGSFNEDPKYSASAGLVGLVLIDNRGNITTGPATATLPTNSFTGSGSASHGILAQALAGGGGAAQGGGSLLSGLGGTDETNPNLADGGDVVVYNTGDITTGGPIAHGILAQSVGGGGGDGGTSTSLAVAIGGSGGGGGSGGAVNVQQSGGRIFAQGALSHGIVAHSIGGGGGNAGAATAAGLGAPVFPVDVAIGGSGGNGGNGGAVTVGLLNTSITAQAANSVGTLAQSIGGGGGAGGSAGAYQAGMLFSASVALGGSGGKGGDGSNAVVGVTNSAIVAGLSPAMTITNPNFLTSSNSFPIDAFGIAAQSIGGGGGKGGNSVADAFSFATLLPATESPITVAASATYSAGGSGNVGGNGGLAEVSIMDGTSVSTLGQGSHGLVSQSTGGGGGLGGDSSAASISLGFGRATAIASGSSLSLDLAITTGGNGGGGGNGGVAQAWVGGNGSNSVGTPSSVTTRGDFANAVYAQSVGGGGGNAGFGTGNASQYGSTMDLNLTVNLGAQGGVGGNGNEVNTLVYGGNTLTTYGDGAGALVAQSIGGGGGTSYGGGFTVGGGYTFTIIGNGDWAKSAYLNANFDLNFNLGATGSAGGTGGAVNVSMNGDIWTQGNDSGGIMAQSVGGGGGIIGSAASQASADNPIRDEAIARGFVTDLVTLTAPTSAGATINLANTPGAGGNGGAVTVNASHNITTLGDWAQGIAAQSLGGGGGKGASALQQQIQIPLDIKFNIAVGNNDIAPASDGGVTTVNLNGTAISTGQNTVTNQSAGYGAYGVLAQSIGGGGGILIDGSQQAQGLIQFGMSTNGGTGGGNGNGGLSQLFTEALTQNSITTHGEAAHGVILQSIGGSGGLAAVGATIIAPPPPPSGTLAPDETPLVPPTSTGVDIYLGGGTDSRGNGGSVSFTDYGLTEISTTGQGASGFIAQSVGGGGGIAMAQQVGTISLGGNAYPTQNHVESYGGDVTVEFAPESTLSTTGAGAHGIIAQSVGGGGGIVNYVTNNNAPIQVGQLTTIMSDFHTSGSGGAIDIISPNTLTTTGNSAFGIIAQSVGAGGGIAYDGSTLYLGTTATTNTDHNGPSIGVGGDVTVVQSGSLSATGENSVGIFAQSIGQGYAQLGQSNGTIGITVNGSVRGGAGVSGVGIWVDGGNNQNSLSIASSGSISAASGNAINFSSGSTLEVNNAGHVTGNVTATSFLNQTNAVFSTGTFVTANVADNGITYVANALPGEIGNTSVTGNYTQTSASTLEFDITGRNTFDTLTITGNGNFSGHVNLWFLNSYSPDTGDYFDLITADSNSDYDFATVKLQNLVDGIEYDTTQITEDSSKVFRIQITAVPEPSSTALLLLAAAILAWQWQKRRDCL